jgi:hypothetical protein
MRSTSPSADDMTGDAATGNVAGGVVFTTVLAALRDELDQVLVLTHLALGIPLAPLARDLQIDRHELQARVDRILTELSGAEMKDRLSGIQRAGQIEHYYPIIARLGLQNWFCARPGCTNLISQSKTGRPRNTCSGRCRSQIHREKAAASGEQNGAESQPQSDALDAREKLIPDETAVRAFILQLMRPINYPSYGWRQPNIHCRDRALLLLGFTCPAPVSVADLRDLDIDDVGKTSAGLEIRLYKRRQNRSAQNVTIGDSDDPRLCSAQALMSWRRVLARSGRTTGPLFIRLGTTGRFLKSDRRLSSNAVTALIWRALQPWGTETWKYKKFRLSESMPLSDFLQEVMGDADLKRAVSRFGPVPDAPLKDDPCEVRNVDSFRA